jgi:hypothetical protein
MPYLSRGPTRLTHHHAFWRRNPRKLSLSLRLVFSRRPSPDRRLVPLVTTRPCVIRRLSTSSLLLFLGLVIRVVQPWRSRLLISPRLALRCSQPPARGLSSSRNHFTPRQRERHVFLPRGPDPARLGSALTLGSCKGLLRRIAARHSSLCAEIPLRARTLDNAISRVHRLNSRVRALLLYIARGSDPYGLGDSYDEPPTSYHHFPLPPESQSAAFLLLDSRRARRPGLAGRPTKSKHVLQYEPGFPGEWLDNAAGGVLSTVRGEQWTE